MSRRIYFRADGNREIGHGHVIRSLALVDMLRDEYDCHFIINQPASNLHDEIDSICKSVILLPEFNSTLDEAQFISKNYLSKSDTIVLDGYLFDTDYQRVIKKSECKMVCIDDIHSYHFLADVVINHAPNLDTSNYSIEKSTKLCLGLSYSILRKPFLEAAQETRTISNINTIFLCFGGSDFYNLSTKILLEIINWFPLIKNIILVIGSSNIHKTELELIISKCESHKVNLLYNLSANEICQQMKEADLAIVPASGILYEVLSVKMPVISGFYAENQMNLYHGFKNLNLIHPIGDLLSFNDYKTAITKINSSDIKKTNALQSTFLTGTSKFKLKRVFNSLLNPSDQIDGRKAKQKDLSQYYEWANEQAVRKNSFSQSKITLEEHIIWFNSKIHSPSCYMYIFEINKSPIGQVRFDIKESHALIDYSIDSFERGKGLGRHILEIAIRLFTQDSNKDEPTMIQGIVKSSNISSIKTFQNIGFKEENEFTRNSVSCKLFIKELI